MKVVLYARVSSDKQDVDLSIVAQLKALREYARGRGDEVVREFVDEAESGRTVQRPVFQEMIALAGASPCHSRRSWSGSSHALPVTGRTPSSTNPCCAAMESR